MENHLKLTSLENRVELLEQKRKCRDVNSLGRTIKEFRKKQGLTQEEMALNLQVTQGLISAYESGRLVPNYEDILVFCDLFDVNPLTFFSKSLEKVKKVGNRLELTIEEHQHQVEQYEENLNSMLQKKTKRILAIMES